MLFGMFVVSEAETAAIRATYEQRGGRTFLSRVHRATVGDGPGARRLAQRWVGGPKLRAPSKAAW